MFSVVSVHQLVILSTGGTITYDVLDLTMQGYLWPQDWPFPLDMEHHCTGILPAMAHKSRVSGDRVPGGRVSRG